MSSWILGVTGDKRTARCPGYCIELHAFLQPDGTRPGGGRLETRFDNLAERAYTAAAILRDDNLRRQFMFDKAIIYNDDAGAPPHTFLTLERRRA